MAAEAGMLPHHGHAPTRRLHGRWQIAHFRLPRNRQYTKYTAPPPVEIRALQAVYQVICDFCEEIRVAGGEVQMHRAAACTLERLEVSGRLGHLEHAKGKRLPGDV